MKAQLLPESYYQAMQKCIEEWTRREVAGVTDADAIEAGHNFAGLMKLLFEMEARYKIGAGNVPAPK